MMEREARLQRRCSRFCALPSEVSGLIGVTQLSILGERTFDALNSLDGRGGLYRRIEQILAVAKILRPRLLLVDVLKAAEVLESQLVDLPSTQAHRSVFFPSGPKPFFEEPLEERVKDFENRVRVDAIGHCDGATLVRQIL